MTRRPSPIARNPLSDQIKNHLLEEILSGRYPPGARVVETRVARELGVSQGPVREALRDLGGLGIIDITAYAGARVRRASKQDLLDAYEVRAELESLGARRAQERASDDVFESLSLLLTRMIAAAARGDVRTEARLDGAFHRRIMELSGNAPLKRVWESLEPVSRTQITLATAVVTPQLIEDLHRPILESLRLEDPKLADDAVRHHFTTLRALLDSVFVDQPAASQPEADPTLDPADSSVD